MKAYYVGLDYDGRAICRRGRVLAIARTVADAHTVVDEMNRKRTEQMRRLTKWLPFEIHKHEDYG